MNLKLIILISLIFTACLNPKKENASSKTRYVCSFSSDSLRLRTEYELIKDVNDSIILYKYINVADSTRNFEISYEIDTKTLLFNFDRYRAFTKNVLQNEEKPKIWFDNYEMVSPIVDGIDPIMFNVDYGILAITGPLNPPHLFLDKRNDTLFGRKILEKLK
ncbi:hypothetical protein [Mangrovimonas aestuarii]|uniref:hypothetical protein n=1 Tax=Mangrovimonas aestuarii TaxID=3018443 RepID=UPI00237863D5|nr:hypothetical protein [Mangrovimonas aestuarii]